MGDRLRVYEVTETYRVVGSAQVEAFSATQAAQMVRDGKVELTFAEPDGHGAPRARLLPDVKPSGQQCTPRQWALLADLNRSKAPRSWVVAHSTTHGAAVIVTQTMLSPRWRSGVSYPVTITPLVDAGLIQLGELEDIPGWATKGYRDRGRPITLTEAGHQALAATGGAQ